MVITGNLKFKEILQDKDFLSLTIKFFFMQMKKDFLFQRQHDDVREMLEKQVFNCQIMRKSVHKKHGKAA